MSYADDEYARMVANTFTGRLHAEVDRLRAALEAVTAEHPLCGLPSCRAARAMLDGET